MPACPPLASPSSGPGPASGVWLSSEGKERTAAPALRVGRRAPSSLWVQEALSLPAFLLTPDISVNYCGAAGPQNLGFSLPLLTSHPNPVSLSGSSTSSMDTILARNQPPTPIVSHSGPSVTSHWSLDSRPGQPTLCKDAGQFPHAHRPHRTPGCLGLEFQNRGFSVCPNLPRPP